MPTNANTNLSERDFNILAKLTEAEAKGDKGMKEKWLV